MTEQPWNRKTILTITDDFSSYEKDVPATIDVYLTETATKAVATATVKVIDMPFNLVFFKTDHLGTPRVITDQDGKVLSTHDYLAYGEELTDPEFTTNRMKFTGHERDPETGLDYMLARYYTSGSGRFLQVDPGKDYNKTDPMSFNLYGYVRGNPIMGTDPTGEADVNLCIVNVTKEAAKFDPQAQKRLAKAAEYTAAQVRKTGLSVSIQRIFPGDELPKTEPGEKNVIVKGKMNNVRPGRTGKDGSTKSDTLGTGSEETGEATLYVNKQGADVGDTPDVDERQVDFDNNLLHETGHVLGLDDVPDGGPDDVMAGGTELGNGKHQHLTADEKKTIRQKREKAKKVKQPQ